MLPTTTTIEIVLMFREKHGQDGWIPKSQMTHILEDLIHKMEGQPSNKQVKWVLGIK